MASNIFQKNGGGENIVNGNVEKALDLSGVQIHGHDPVRPCRRDEIGHQFGADRHARLDLPVLPCVSVIGDNCRYPLRRGPFQGIHDDQEFHEIVVHGARCRLQDKNIFTPDIFTDFNLRFTVAKGLGCYFTLIDTKIMTYFLSDYRV